MAQNPADDPTSIGCLLINLGAATDDQLQEAVTVQREAEPDTLLGMVMVAKAMITPEQLEHAMKMQKDLRGRRKDKQALAQATLAEASMDRAVASAHRMRDRVQLRFAGGNGRIK
jgi:predicted TIM-barrel fold metal-dependent hydrolase